VVCVTSEVVSYNSLCICGIAIAMYKFGSVISFSINLNFVCLIACVISSSVILNFGAIWH
jgi:hypothetical protein